MQIDVIEFIHNHHNRGEVLASVRIGLIDDAEHGLIVDVHVLKNEHGQLSVAIPTSGAAVFSAQLERDVEDVVLPAYEEWSTTGRYGRSRDVQPGCRRQGYLH